jgi:Uma2 family endonuclease
VLKTKIKIGPKDHGRQMSLEDFEFAEVQPGYRYELSRGVITVSDIPSPAHFCQLDEIRQQLFRFELGTAVHLWVLGAGECKLLVPTRKSERHPDAAIYLTGPPNNDNTVWRIWIPEIVIEVVSEESAWQDYEEKPEDYLALGVREYWIIDRERREMLARRWWLGLWAERVVRVPDCYRTPLLPGFELNLAPVFAAADFTPRRRSRRHRT